MKPKVYRHHTNGIQGIDWFELTDPIGPIQIETIKNPQGLTSTKQITSIPSPFARIDLVKTAFANIINKNQLLENNLYHRLVSETLDLAQILFEYSLFSQQEIDIIVWERKEHLDDELLNSDDPRHELLGNTLDLYLKAKQGASVYNFNLLDRLYIIRYKKSQILGATSPSTMFFSTANVNQSLNIKLGNHNVFDPKKFLHLYERSNNFQKYLYHYVAYVDSKKQSLFNKKMPEFAAYLAQNLKILEKRNYKLFAEIQDLKANPASFLGLYEPLSIGGANAPMDILGEHYYHISGISSSIVENTSELVIKSTYCPLPNHPLVVLPGLKEKGIIYFDNITWDEKTEVRYKDFTKIEDRTLPGYGYKYPYITVSDFLESHLISLPYEINSNFTNTYLKHGTQNYLLPLTSVFFEYFSTNDLDPNSGKVKIGFNLDSSTEESLTVSLRIPTSGGYRIFERTYKRIKQIDDALTFPETTGYQEGAILNWSLAVLIYPFLRLPTSVPAHYRVMLVDANKAEKNNTAGLDFFRVGPTLQRANPQRTTFRSDKKSNDDAASTIFSILEEDFDLIQFRLPFKGQEIFATIIPNWPEYNPRNPKVRVAVDFGTTNTHIHIDSNEQFSSSTKYNWEVGSPFRLLGAEHLGSLHKCTTDEEIRILRAAKVGSLVDPIFKEFIPPVIGERYRFPTRTALNARKGLDVLQATDVFADLTLPFYLERDLAPSNSENYLNLKWSDTSDPKNRERIKHYIDLLLLLIRNKVLLLGGDLNQTELIWFYPSSMADARLTLFTNAWNKAYSRYITSGKGKKTIRLSESLAPFYYYHAFENVSVGARPTVGVDIGGGTTDIVVFDSEGPKYLSSFTYAANAIYGDGYNGNPGKNGFISRYKDQLKELLQKSELTDIVAMLNGANQSSVELVSFFFSLDDHPDIIEKKIPLNFASMLQEDGQLKMVLMLFYIALFYHIAQFMKALKIPSPQFVIFSGKGSRLTSIIDADIDLTYLSKLTTLIFSYVYEVDSPSIELKQTDKPKEITSQGGLMDEAILNEVPLDNLKTVLSGTAISEIIKPSEGGRTYSNIKSNKDYQTEVINEVKKLGNLLTHLDSKFRFKDKFLIDPAALRVAIDSLKDENLLINSYETGLKNRLSELGGQTDDPINETLFFYPLIGVLNAVSQKVTKL